MKALLAFLLSLFIVLGSGLFLCELYLVYATIPAERQGQERAYWFICSLVFAVFVAANAASSYEHSKGEKK